MWKSLVLCAVLFLHPQSIPTAVNGYSMGAPNAACDEMIPGHGAKPQDTPSPYTIEIEKETVEIGEKIGIRLVGAPGTQFLGFLIQARNATTDRVTGMFSANEYHLLTCGQGFNNAVTHRKGSPKSEVNLQWNPDAFTSGPVIFKASFVQDYNVYWVRLMSRPITVVKRSAVTSPPKPEETSPKDLELPQAVETTPGVVTTTSKTPILASNAKAGTSPLSELYSSCGVRKGCFGSPNKCTRQKNCDILVTYKKLGNRYEMELYGKTNGYVAAGLSTDIRMGTDAVMECVQTDGKVKLFASYNEGRSNKRIENDYLEMLESTYKDGELYCKFLRNAKTVVEGETFDMNLNQYYLLIASGQANDYKIGYHESSKLSMGRPTALGIANEVAGNDNLLLRLHGAFMIAAWIGASCCGMIIARYYKQTWVGYRCCAKDMWFVWHRMFMVLTWSLTVAGFVLIFVHVSGWTQIPLTENPHPILGVVTTALCFIQPFMALMRCTPDHKKRYVFNWAHWIVGNSAQILGIVTIFFAVELSPAELPQWMDWILVAFVSFHGLMHLILSIQMCWSDDRQRRRSNSFALREISASGGRPMPDIVEKKDAPGSGFRKFVLGAYLLINWIFTAALIATVVLAPAEKYLQDLGIIG